MTDIAHQLAAAGLSEREAAAKERLFQRCLVSLSDARSPAAGQPAVFFVPGRIEILGKHTDYAGGRSLLCTVERGFVVVAVPRDDNTVRVSDAVSGETRSTAMDGNLVVPAGDWGLYVAATVRRLARNFPDARRGADIAFASDLPQASGLSSSSALSTAIFLALDAMNGIQATTAYRSAIRSREDLAGYLGTIENGQSFGTLDGDAGVGTFGGSEDHTAIICCRSGVVSRYSFSPVRPEVEIALDDNLVFVIGFCGVAAEKGSGAQVRYNELSLCVQQLLTLWNASTGRRDPSLAAAVASAADAPDRLRVMVRATADAVFSTARLLERLDQFVSESSEIIPLASDALARGDLSTFGELVERSQRGAESLLRNQIPETIMLARSALSAGAHGASAFGGGFGGSVWALVNRAGADSFLEEWAHSFQASFPAAAVRAEFFMSRPGPAALRI